jgi:purine nucleosidase
MKKVIFDCDNTMGIEGCDVDDGLALLYLLGKGDTDICGITSTYGNSNVDAVYANTALMLKELDRTEIPLFKGCPDQYTLQSEAADFIVATVNRYPNHIAILATGSLTNLLAAYFLDRTIFDKISEIVLMGGITKALIINGRVLDELNFSCDSAASECVLKNGHHVSVITGNNCLEAFFPEEEFLRRLATGDAPSARYIIHKCMYWFKNMMTCFKLDGFHNWDVVAAAFLANPSLFSNNFQFITPDHEQLKKGLLGNVPACAMPVNVNIPTIKDRKTFEDDVYSAWLKVKVRN